MIEHSGEVDRRRVAADADSVDGARWPAAKSKNHEAQRERRKGT